MVPGGCSQRSEAPRPPEPSYPRPAIHAVSRSLEEIGHWGARELTTGSSKDDELPAPHLLWPGDHRWFVATDVDSDFTSVGGSQELIDAVIRDPKLKAERVHRL